MGRPVVHFELMSKDPAKVDTGLEEQQVSGMGAFSLFTDPEGRMMGLWKAAT